MDKDTTLKKLADVFYLPFCLNFYVALVIRKDKYLAYIYYLVQK